MELTTIRELFKNREAYLDQKVTVGGWVRSIRDSKTFGFMVINDGSYFQTLQVVYHDIFLFRLPERPETLSPVQAGRTVLLLY